MAEKSVFERLRDETQRRTVAVLALLGLVYAYFFLPESVLNYFREGLGSLWSNLVSLGLVTSIGGVLGYVISALDLLATGEGQAAHFFRRQYPSGAIVEKYECTQAEANYLWFNIFNPWQNIGPLKDSYRRTFERSFACRFIFVLQWGFLIFLSLSLGTWVVILGSALYGGSLESYRPGAVFARALILLLTLLVCVILFWRNRSSVPTGCWFRWREINDIHRQWLQDKVFAAATTYQDAVSLVSSATWRQTNGYP